MPPYDPDYDDSYLDQMDHELEAQVQSIMHIKAAKQAESVYKGMKASGIKRFKPRPQMPTTMRSDLAVFMGGPEDGKLIAIPKGTYDWIVAEPLRFDFTKSFTLDDLAAPITIRRGRYCLEGVATNGTQVVRAFIWQGWDGER